VVYGNIPFLFVSFYFLRILLTITLFIRNGIIVSRL